MLTRTAGLELAPHNILIVGVGPGAVATPINTATMQDPALLTATTVFADGGLMQSSPGP